MGCVILTRKLFNLPIRQSWKCIHILGVFFRVFFLGFFFFFLNFMVKSGAAKAAPPVAVPNAPVWDTLKMMLFTKYVIK